MASPDYLQRSGSLSQLGELESHTCLTFQMPGTGRTISWLFREAEQDVEWNPTGRVQLTNDVLGVVSLAEQSRAWGFARHFDLLLNSV